jgi:2-C-methyl-D-erythritol 4-phosphate cytidylyltransferase
MDRVSLRDTSVIIVAGGIGSRMGTPIPKQFLPLGGIPIVLHSFHIFAELEDVAEIVVVCELSYQKYFPNVTKPIIRFADPGDRRQDSVWNGLQACCESSKLICIHDSARPFLQKEDVLSVLAAAREHKAAALGAPVKQTIKQTDENDFVAKTLDRTFVWEIHTPQVIAPDLLRKGFEIAFRNNITVTDDVSLVELTSHPVKLVRGADQNLKVTTPTDLTIAQALYSQLKK